MGRPLGSKTRNRSTIAAATVTPIASPAILGDSEIAGLNHRWEELVSMHRMFTNMIGTQLAVLGQDFAAYVSRQARKTAPSRSTQRRQTIQQGITDPSVNGYSQPATN